MSQNLHGVVNRAVSERDSKFKKFKTVNVVAIEEGEELDCKTDDQDSISVQEFDENAEHSEDDQMQLMAFLAVANKEPCKRSGVGPDGKLKCKFLGGTKAACIFTHPEFDMKLKGRGYTSIIQSSKSSFRTDAGGSA